VPGRGDDSVLVDPWGNCHRFDTRRAKSRKSSW
jgi:hypothetical protein